MKIEKYIDQHPQEVSLSWVDGTKRTYPAKKAFLLCQMPRTVACIMGAECEDKKLEAMLNELLNDE